MGLYTQLASPYIILICLLWDTSHVSSTQRQARRSIFPITAILQCEARRSRYPWITLIANFYIVRKFCLKLLAPQAIKPRSEWSRHMGNSGGKKEDDTCFQSLVHVKYELSSRTIRPICKLLQNVWMLTQYMNIYQNTFISIQYTNFHQMYHLPPKCIGSYNVNSKPSTRTCSIPTCSTTHARSYENTYTMRVYLQPYGVWTHGYRFLVSLQR